MNKIEFTDKNGTFRIHNPENYSGLYLPLAGETGLKSSITPNLGGDSKTDQNHFLLEPVSIENLHNNRNTRNFWCRIENKGSWSVCGSSAKQEAAKFTKDQDESILEAGFMWQKLTRISKEYEMKAETTSFVTIDGTMEVMMTELTNTADQEQKITPIAAIPVYGRSADNIRDHRHVTSLLHRIETKTYGVEVCPVLSFDERGHQKNQTAYFVYCREQPECIICPVSRMSCFLYIRSIVRCIFMSRIVCKFNQRKSSSVIHLCGEHKTDFIYCHFRCQMNHTLNILYCIAVTISVS